MYIEKRENIVAEITALGMKNDVGIIDLRARFREYPLYVNLGYKHFLMIQVFDFSTVEDVNKKNKFNFDDGFSWQGETYGFIFYKTPDIKKIYDNVRTSHAQFIFEKDFLKENIRSE